MGVHYTILDYFPPPPSER
ncbi:unnamed protein product [Victoria cruziana]